MYKLRKSLNCTALSRGGVGKRKTKNKTKPGDGEGGVFIWGGWGTHDKVSGGGWRVLPLFAAVTARPACHGAAGAQAGNSLRQAPHRLGPSPPFAPEPAPRPGPRAPRPDGSPGGGDPHPPPCLPRRGGAAAGRAAPLTSPRAAAAGSDRMPPPPPPPPPQRKARAPPVPAPPRPSRPQVNPRAGPTRPPAPAAYGKGGQDTAKGGGGRPPARVPLPGCRHQRRRRRRPAHSTYLPDKPSPSATPGVTAPPAARDQRGPISARLPSPAQPIRALPPSWVTRCG